MNSCLVVAGEKSGEEHTLSFFSELKQFTPGVSYYGVGGDDLRDLGLEELFHIKDFSSWGYSGVINKIPFYLKAMEQILFEVDKRKTKVAILVDYQSFNLKLAEKLKSRGVDVLYYVAPQAWAWKEYRVQKIKNCVHTLFCILRFEKEWFMERGVASVVSVDHPLWTTYKHDLMGLERSQASLQEINQVGKINLLLLPGSRNFEVESLLPIFVEAIKDLKKKLNVSVSIVKSPSVSDGLFTGYNDIFDNIYSDHQLVSALKKADIAIAASGTVTLTCAMFEVPTIVCYRTSLFNQFIFEQFVNYQGAISLANIVQKHAVFPEFLQDRVTSYNIVSQICFWYYNSEKYRELKVTLKQTKELVQGEGVNVPEFMASVINKAYGIKSNFTS